MRSVSGEAAIQVLGELGLKLRDEPLNIGDLRPGPILQTGLATETELLRPLREGLSEQRHERGTVTAQRERMPGKLCIPARQRRARCAPGAYPSYQRIALHQGPRVVAAGRDAGGPQ